MQATRIFSSWYDSIIFQVTFMFCTTGAIGSVVSYFTSSAQSHSIIDLNCTGNETTILSCPQNGLAGYACSINRDANVFCQCK